MRALIVNGPSTRSYPASAAMSVSCGGRRLRSPTSTQGLGPDPSASSVTRSWRRATAGSSDRCVVATDQCWPAATTRRHGRHPPLAAAGQLDDLRGRAPRRAPRARCSATPRASAWRAPTPARRRAPRRGPPPGARTACAPARGRAPGTRRHRPPAPRSPGDRARRGGTADGIGHTVLEVPRDDPHQRSLALGGRLQRCTSASRSPAPVVSPCPPTSSPTGPTSHARTPSGCWGTSRASASSTSVAAPATTRSPWPGRAPR